jgi:hypothetical protein
MAISKKVWIYGGVVAGVVALGFAAKPAYRALREYRTGRNLAAAQAAVRDENWTVARDKARSVLLVRQDDFEAFRIWARARVKLGEPSAYLAASRLVTDPRASREDRLETLRMMVAKAPQAMVLGLYSCLPKDLSAQPSFRAALIPLLIQRGAIDLAEKGLREVAQPPLGADVRLEMLRTLCARPSTQRVTQARHIFADLVAAKANDEALAALLLLGAVPGGLAAGEPLPDLPEWLKHQPAATATHHLLGMDPALTAKPEAAASCYQSAIKRFLVAAPAALGAWLVRHGQADMAVRILEEPAVSCPDAYLARLHALLGLERQTELKAALATPPAAVDAVELEIVQARYASLSGDPIAADAAWTRALNSAAFDTGHNRFIEIARTAEACHAKEGAANAWVAAIRMGWGPLPLYSDLLPLYHSLVSKGRSEDLLAMFRSMLRFEPTNTDLQNNFCYMSLIHGIMTPGQVTAAMLKVVEQDDQPGYHATLMLAEILDGRPADALAQLPKFRDDKGVAAVLKTALEVIARVLAGEAEAGVALVNKIVWRGLMPQEQIVFRDLLVKHKISGLPLPELDSPKTVAAPEQTPAWRKAIEHLEKSDNSKQEVNPSQTPAWRKAVERSADSGNPKPESNPDQTPAWRKAVERLGKDRAGEVLPPLPPPKIQ